MANDSKPSIRKYTPPNVWLKNATRSMGLASQDMIQKLTPSIGEFITSNVDYAKELKDAATEAQKNSKSMTDMFNAKEYVNIGKDALKNALEDIQTGKLWNSERENEMFDFDDFDFEDFDGPVTAGDQSDTFKVQRQINVVNQSHGAEIVKAVASSTKATAGIGEAVIKSQAAIAEKQSVISQRTSIATIKGLESINDNLGLLVNFQNDSMTKYIGASIKYYDESLQAMNKTMESLVALSTPKQIDKKSSKNPIDDVFGMNGGFNLKGYVNNLKGNVEEMKSTNMAFQMLDMMFSDSDTLKYMAQSPLQFLAKAGVSTMLNKNSKNALANLDKTFSAFMPAMAMKTNKLKDSDNPILKFFGDLFGVESKSKTAIDHSRYVRGAVPFDGETKKAITEVIPTWLQKIYSAVSGTEETTFDYEKGTWRKVSEMQEDIERDIQRKAISGYSDIISSMKDRMDNFLIEDREERETFMKGINSFFENLAKKDSLVNPHKASELESVFDFGGNVSMQELFQSLLLTSNKNDIMGAMGRGTMQSRSALKKFYEELEANPTTSAIGYLTNGKSFNEHLKKGDDGKYVAKAGGSMLHRVDKFGNDDLHYLRGIMKTLQQGIEVYNIGGGGGPDGPNDPSLTSRIRDMRSRTAEFEREERIYKQSQLAQANANHSSSTVSDYARRSAEREGKTVVDSIYDLTEGGVEATSNRLKSMDDVVAAKGKRESDKKGFKNFIGSRLSGDTQDNFYKFANKVEEYTNKPAKVLEAAFNKIDATLYNIAFGVKGDGKGSFIDGTLNRMTVMFEDVGTFAKDRIFKPIADFVFGEEGLVKKATDSPFYKFMTTNVKNFFMGEKDAAGNSINGVFSGAVNGAKDLGRFIVHSITGKEYVDSNGVKHEKDPKSAFNVAKDIFKDAAKSTKEYIFGSKDKGEKGAIGGLGSMLKDGVEEWRSALFGPKKKGERDKVNARTMGELGKKVGRGLPKGVLGAMAGSALGAGVVGATGLFGSMFLPMAPMGLAIAGMALGMGSESERFSNWAFGPKNDNGKRSGGAILGAHKLDFLRRHKNSMIGGAAVGLATMPIKSALTFGLLPSFLMPGGPLGAAVMGAAAGVIFRSEKVQTLLFGPKNADGKRVGGALTKMFGGFGQKLKDGMGGDVKKRLATIGIGGAGGLGLGTLIGTTGLLGAMLSPAAPIGLAIAGTAAGISLTSEKWKKAVFGEWNENTLKREGGLFQKFSNWNKLHVMDPLKHKAQDTISDMGFWFKDTVVESTKFAFTPITSVMKHAAEDVRSAFKGFKDMIGIQFKEQVTAPIGKVMTKLFFDPLKFIMDKTFNLQKGLFKFVVGAPFKLLEGLGYMSSLGDMARGAVKTYTGNLNEATNSENSLGQRFKHLGKALNPLELARGTVGEHGASYLPTLISEKKMARQEAYAQRQAEKDQIKQQRQENKSRQKLGWMFGHSNGEDDQNAWVYNASKSKKAFQLAFAGNKDREKQYNAELKKKFGLTANELLELNSGRSLEHLSNEEVKMLNTRIKRLKKSGLQGEDALASLGIKRVQENTGALNIAEPQQQKALTDAIEEGVKKATISRENEEVINFMDQTPQAKAARKSTFEQLLDILTKSKDAILVKVENTEDIGGGDGGGGDGGGGGMPSGSLGFMDGGGRISQNRNTSTGGLFNVLASGGMAALGAIGGIAGGRAATTMGRASIGSSLASALTGAGRNANANQRGLLGGSFGTAKKLGGFIARQARTTNTDSMLGLNAYGTAASADTDFQFVNDGTSEAEQRKKHSQRRNVNAFLSAKAQQAVSRADMSFKSANLGLLGQTATATKVSAEILGDIFDLLSGFFNWLRAWLENFQCCSTPMMGGGGGGGVGAGGRGGAAGAAGRPGQAGAPGKGVNGQPGQAGKPGQPGSPGRGPIHIPPVRQPQSPQPRPTPVPNQQPGRQPYGPLYTPSQIPNRNNPSVPQPVPQRQPYGPIRQPDILPQRGPTVAPTRQAPYGPTTRPDIMPQRGPMVVPGPQRHIPIPLPGQTPTRPVVVPTPTPAQTPAATDELSRRRQQRQESRPTYDTGRSAGAAIVSPSGTYDGLYGDINQYDGVERHTDSRNRQERNYDRYYYGTRSKQTAVMANATRRLGKLDNKYGSKIERLQTRRNNLDPNILSNSEYDVRLRVKQDKLQAKLDAKAEKAIGAAEKKSQKIQDKADKTYSRRGYDKYLDMSGNQKYERATGQYDRTALESRRDRVYSEGQEYRSRQQMSGTQTDNVRRMPKQRGFLGRAWDIMSGGGNQRLGIAATMGGNSGQILPGLSQDELRQGYQNVANSPVVDNVAKQGGKNLAKTGVKSGLKSAAKLGLGVMTGGLATALFGAADYAYGQTDDRASQITGKNVEDLTKNDKRGAGVASAVTGLIPFADLLDEAAFNGKMKESIAKVTTGALDMVGNLGESMTKVKETVSEGWETAKTTIGNAVTGVKDAATEKWEAMKTSASEGWENAKTTITTKVDAVKTAATEKWESMKKTASDGWENAKENISTKVNDVKTAATEKWESMRKTASDGWENAKENISTKVNELKTNATEKWESMRKTASDKWEETKETIGTKATSIKTAASDKFEEAKGLVTTGLSGLGTLASTFASGITSALSSAFSTASSALSGLASKAYEIGSGAVSKGKEIGSNIVNKGKDLWNKVTGKGVGGPSSDDSHLINMSKDIEKQYSSSQGFAALKDKKRKHTFGSGVIMGDNELRESINNEFGLGFGSDCADGSCDTTGNGPSDVYYSQNDPRWSNDSLVGKAKMGKSGCGSAAVSMAVSSLTGEAVTPREANEFAKRNKLVDERKGTSSELFQKFGQTKGVNFKQAQPNEATLKENLSKGNKVILRGQGGENYTNSGHYIVATGLDSKGNIKINDPISKSRSGNFSYEQLQNNTTHAFVATAGNGDGQQQKVVKKPTHGAGATKGIFSHPVPSARLSSPFGWRNIGDGKEFHYGIDLAQGGDVNIQAAADGVVTKARNSGTYGNVVIIRHDIDGRRMDTTYAHLRTIGVREGDTVKRGQVVGKMGSTGRSTGQHLHFEIHNGEWKYTNGTMPNAVDPKPYIYEGAVATPNPFGGENQTSGVLGRIKNAVTSLFDAPDFVKQYEHSFSVAMDNLLYGTNEAIGRFDQQSGSSDSSSSSKTTYNVDHIIPKNAQEEIVKKTFELTLAREGGGDPTMVKNDMVPSGQKISPSIGILQWRQGTAKALMDRILAQNPNGINAEWARSIDWQVGADTTSTKPWGASDISKLQAYLKSNPEVTKKVQEEYAMETIKNRNLAEVYKHLVEPKKMTDPRGIVYLGDFANTGPAHVKTFGSKFSGQDNFPNFLNQFKSKSYWGNKSIYNSRMSSNQADLQNWTPQFAKGVGGPKQGENPIGTSTIKMPTLGNGSGAITVDSKEFNDPNYVIKHSPFANGEGSLPFMDESLIDETFGSGRGIARRGTPSVSGESRLDNIRQYKDESTKINTTVVTGNGDNSLSPEIITELLALLSEIAVNTRAGGEIKRLLEESGVDVDKHMASKGASSKQPTKQPDTMNTNRKGTPQSGVDRKEYERIRSIATMRK